MPKKNNTLLFEETVSLYKKAKANLQTDAKLETTRNDILEHLEASLFSLACLLVPQGRQAKEKTNQLLREHGLDHLCLA